MPHIYSAAEIHALARPKHADAGAACPGTFAARRGAHIYIACDTPLRSGGCEYAAKLFGELATEHTTHAVISASREHDARHMLIAVSISATHSLAEYAPEPTAGGKFVTAVEIDHAFCGNVYARPVEGEGADAAVAAFGAVVSDITENATVGRVRVPFDHEHWPSVSDVQYLAAGTADATFSWSPKDHGATCAAYGGKRLFIDVEKATSPHRSVDALEEALHTFVAQERLRLPYRFTAFVTDGDNVLACLFSPVDGYSATEVLACGESFGHYNPADAAHSVVRCLNRLGETVPTGSKA
jgi:hypothetical protein